jgi:hypothetical protein
MAIHWHWAFGNETPANLAANAGFYFSTTNAFYTGPTSTVAQVYSYAGSPTRFALYLSDAQSLTFPAQSGAGVTSGWVAVPVQVSPAISLVSAWNILSVSGASRTTFIRMSNIAGSNCNLSLYVDSVFKGTGTTVYSMLDYQYLSLKFDMSTATHSAELWVNGALEIGPFTDAAAPATSVSISMQAGSGSPGNTWRIGQIIVYNDTADAGHVPRFVTRVEPNADGTNTGTWTPSTGSDDYAVVDSPLDVTTYTEDGAPTTGNRLELLTSGGSSNLAVALGVNPSNIDSVLHHNYSDGATVDVQAKVGDGTSETAGATVTIPASGTTYAYAIANTRPSGGAWTGSDAPSLVYEIV